MLAPVLKDVLAKANNFDASLVQEICIGNVNQPGAGSTTSRMAQFLGDIPHTTPLYGINRLCSSGLQAIMDVANSIRAGQIDCGIGGGVESMSMYDMQKSIDPEKLSDQIFENERAQKCLMPMGITSENVAQKYGLTRTQLDQMAVDSHAKAAHAQKMGWPKDEITVYKTTFKDKEGNEKEVVIDRDDGVRP